MVLNLKNNTEENTDEELAELSLLDKEAFRFLIDRYEERLRRYAVRLGIDKIGETDDLLQEVFIKAYQNLASFDSNLSFSSWIYRITHNEAVTIFRKRRVRPEGHMNFMEEEDLRQIASDVDVFEDILNEELRLSVQKSISLLDDKFKEIIILKYLEDKSYDEISDILKISPGTVASRINRAKEKLDKIIKKEKTIYE